ncbi:MAG: 5-formyltetrahydrofolate cyclo-ligase [Planctomycetaceae bacterium]|jgi:5-formyltetrahydrofolate cyclo-ligase|nr:5-formyltetrahydrofolate cyclo-ligase [Planctomycetaceae bacterium]
MVFCTIDETEMSNDKLTLRKIMRSKLRENFLDNVNLRTNLSMRIWDLLRQLSVFKKAEIDNSLMLYLDMQNEIETARFMKLPTIIPFCQDDEIVPFCLFSLDELSAGYYGILEPKRELRGEVGRIFPHELLSVVIVSGLAFDTNGNRLGRGKGFYDRFISKLKNTTITIALCAEFQIIESVPITQSDKPVNIIVTENRVIYCH